MVFVLRKDAEEGEDVIKIIILLLFLSLNVFSKLIIVSDIDETIKQSNVMDYKDAIKRIVYGKDIPYYGLGYIFQELKDTYETEIHYVSASYKFIYDAGDWLVKHRVPYTTYLQRPILEDKYRYKFLEIERIILQGYTKGDIVLLFGDNNELDQLVYSDLMKKYNKNINILSFVRDIKGIYTTPLTNIYPKDGVFYFLTELDLFKYKIFSKLKRSQSLIKNFNPYFLLPKYTRTFISSYLGNQLCLGVILKMYCQEKVKKDLSIFFELYFNQKWI